MSNQRGNLKIFFGYAAGVGKTYAMLDAAQAEQKAGKDVVAGYIEPHARPDTLALLKGLEVLPPLSIDHKGIQVHELDLDGVLARRPQIVLVDELAHTNAEECRHRKRWQDVQEILDAGIDVYTTVNVQHLESLCDIVASITHVRVSERVPDKVFNDADQVELVDIEPEELIARMEAGKIYRKDQAARAAQHFFTKENLTALREIALRRTADHVNRDVVRGREAGGNKEYYTGEHVLVCVSPAPSNQKVIRTAARMAFAFHGKLTAVVVETPEQAEEKDKFKKALEDNINLAKQFGADAVTLYGEEVAEQIADYARQNGVSKIVVGRTVRRTGLAGLLDGKKNMIDQLIALAPNLDVYVIPDVRAQAQTRRWYKVKPLRRMNGDTAKELSRELAAGALLLAAATVFGHAMEFIGMGDANLIMAYMMAVILTAVFSRFQITGVLTSFASVLLYNFFFTDPRFTFQAASGYPFTFLFMLVCALLVSSLAARLKRQVKKSREESGKMQIIIAFSNQLKLAAGSKEILEVCAIQLAKLLRRSVIIYRSTDQGLIRENVYLWEEADPEEEASLTAESEQAVASWVWKNCHKAGCTTDTLPGSAGYYVPVRMDGVTYGVIGIKLKEKYPLDAGDKNLLHMLLDETAVALKAKNL